jgi:hypothetical protein
MMEKEAVAPRQSIVQLCGKNSMAPKKTVWSAGKPYCFKEYDLGIKQYGA